MDLIQYFLKLIPDFTILDYIEDYIANFNNNEYTTEPWFNIRNINSIKADGFPPSYYRTLIFSPVKLTKSVAINYNIEQDYGLIEIGNYHEMFVYISYVPEDQYMLVSNTNMQIKINSTNYNINDYPYIVEVLI